jgi:hypothetical protein
VTFTIDTGPAMITGPLRHVPEWFRYEWPDPLDPAIVKAYAEHIVGGIDKKVSPHYIRKDLLKAWAFLGELGEADPASWEWVLTEFAERLAAVR